MHICQLFPCFKYILTQHYLGIKFEYSQNFTEYLCFFANMREIYCIFKTFTIICRHPGISYKIYLQNNVTYLICYLTFVNEIFVVFSFALCPLRNKHHSNGSGREFIDFSSKWFTVITTIKVTPTNNATECY